MPKSTTTPTPRFSNNSTETTDSKLKTYSDALALLPAPLPATADISGLTPCKESKQIVKQQKQSIKELESSLKNVVGKKSRGKYSGSNNAGGRYTGGGDLSRLLLARGGALSRLAIKATIEKTKRRFENYGKDGLQCGSDRLPHQIVSGDQRH
ncbi:Photosystem I reaction center subunit III [Arachis hypogaea]|nr:Photosystem I reaction center subunit III [Arachis hypogaea]